MAAIRRLAAILAADVVSYSRLIGGRGGSARRIERFGVKVSSLGRPDRPATYAASPRSSPLMWQATRG